ncbi:protein-disulfide reductase DsbD domain-containing protein [Sphingobacterium hungaricum]|nr:protein-disulfide reductase DsbD domain-containing protein [Sphingobacterium hungaricum]
MKKLNLVIAVFIFSITASFAQIYNPVKWEVAFKKFSSTEATVYIKATIEDGWHIYSQTVGDGGPIATSFKYKASKDFALNGKTIEPKAKTKYEDVFKMNVPYFSKEVVFQQKVKLNAGKAAVSGTVEFMACDAERCLPPDEYAFTVNIK